MKITRFCPAKINLFLEVTGRQSNGYHTLATLFAKINLGDMLTVEVTPAPETNIFLQVTGSRGKYIPASSHNLAWKAAQAFLDYYHITAHIHLTLEKNIPTGAGLGGGSSDAAGVLTALCEIFDKNPLDLIELATTLGADVALFLYPNTFLKGEGIGEKLTPIPAGKVLPSVVLVYPNTAVSTKDVFSRLQLPPQEEILTNLAKLDKLVHAVQCGIALPEWGQLLFNRLEEQVLPFVPAVKDSLEVLQNICKGSCRMSGSGSSVFALVGTNFNALQIE